MNTLGTDGYNTCYNYNQKGLIVGYTYNITLKLGSSFNNGNLSDNKQTLNDHKAKELARYLSKLFQQIDSASTKGAAIRYKIRRLSDKELYERMDMSVDDWDSLALDPIAKHTGQVRKVYEGLIWAMPNIKIPEPIFDGCMSIMPDGWRGIPRPKKTDTPILAYFIGDELRVIKYYVDDEQVKLEIESDFEEVMVIGEWEKTEVAGKGKLHGDIYLTTKDDRVVYADSKKTTTILGKSVGYTKASFQMDHYFWRTGTLYRDWYYTHHTKVTKEDNKKLSLGAIMPYYCRNLLLYAKSESTQAVHTYEELKLKSVKDPHSYRIWTDTKSMLLFGRLETTKGKPHPEYGRPVWAEIHQYHPNQYNAFADSGDWVGYPLMLPHLSMTAITGQKQNGHLLENAPPLWF